MYRCTTKSIEGFNLSQKYMLVQPTCMWRNDIILTENLSRKWFEFEWGGVNKSQTSDEPFESQTKIPNWHTTKVV